MKNKFERTLSNPFFRYSKRFLDLILLNLLFCIISVLSIFVLLIPCLVSLHKITNDMLNDTENNYFKEFFTEIKRQWSFSWRLEVVFVAVAIVTGTLLYFDYVYMFTVKFDFIAVGSFIFLTVFDLVLLTLMFNLMVYNSYIFNDTFQMMVKKTAVVSLKKFLHSILLLIIFIAFIVVCYFVPYIIPFLPFSFFVYVNESYNKKLFSNLAREEAERELLDENLFLPTEIKEKSGK